jgi:hypothetical protein
MDYIDNPINTKFIQDELTERFLGRINFPRQSTFFQPSLSVDEKSFKPIAIPSMDDKNRIKFNGFCFAINVTGTKNLALPYSNFFNNTLLMVGQEDDLAKRMQANNMIPMIAKFAFVYHYKSVTVSMAKTVLRYDNFTGDLLATHHPYISRNGFDNRENLSYYHPELQSSTNNQTVMTHHSLNQAIDYSAVREANVDHIRIYPSTDDTITIGFAVSHPNISVGAGDVYTAYELGESLSKIFMNVRCIYLYRGPQWYDSKELQSLDILVAMLDAYDIAQAQLHIASGGRSSTIYIAWVRNWFQRWLMKSYIGNYDLLLISSSTAYEFYRSYAKQYGFSVKCVHHCPAVYLRANASSSHISRIILGTGKRARVPMEVFRIATNPHRFSQDRSNIYQYRPYQFIFTGSYYNRSRDLMSFNPLSINNAEVDNILLIGENWNHANLSMNWRRVSAGPRSYESLVYYYRNSKIVLDDANIATREWGSVNSRVYDAIACGALVISNGLLGNIEVFNGSLPSYQSAEFDLKHVIDYNLQHDQKRFDLAKKLRKHVLMHHTYENRSWHFQSLIQRFGIQLIPRNTSHHHEESESPPTANITEICLGIRTVTQQQMDVQLLIESILMQHLRSKHQAHIHINIFIIDTEAIDLSTSWHELVDQLNEVSVKYYTDIHQLAHRLRIFVIHHDAIPIGRSSSMRRQNRLFGYDDSDLLMDTLLAARAKRCDWIMHTNGDNIYNAAWFDIIAAHILDPDIDIIGWDFVTHHRRGAGLTQQLISIRLDRGYVDLGSVIARQQLYLPISDLSNNSYTIQSNCTRAANTSISISRSSSRSVRFLPDSIFTHDIHARDFFTVQSLIKQARNQSIRLIHQCLLFHQ